ncbi:MAG TPA: MazG nucleotide pyrophosphohydrolase domain-containing protein, partial [Solirubrobacterales bacterium]|nr:MazG nucleotide pyrophosphohydrolase domain-containing protein [Solirubrobacterales bacterium]
MESGELAGALERLDRVTRELREKCPWDREQDARSIVPHTVEEAFELAEAAREGDDPAMRDELGDVLFQVVFLSLLMEERGEGDLARIANQLTDKLIRRHPHVYPPEQSGRSEGIETADDVRRQWDEIKRDVEGRKSEKDWKKPALPALIYANKVQ